MERTGFLADFRADDTDNSVSSGMIRMLPSWRYRLELRMEVTGNCSGQIEGTDTEHNVLIQASGSSLFNQAVTFSSTGPVFDL